MKDSARRDPKERSAWAPAALFASAALVRLALLSQPGNVSDISTLVVFATQVNGHGLHTLYDPPALRSSPEHYTYPLVVPALLAGTFRVWASLTGIRLVASDSDPAAAAPPYHVSAAIAKLWAIAGDLAIGWVLYRWVSRRSGRRSGLWCAAAFLFSPGVVYVSAVWGQVDSLLALCVLCSVLAAATGRVGLAWSTLALGVLVKPQAVVVAPVIVVATLSRRGWSGLARGMAMGLATGLVLTAPFWLTGRGERLLRAYSAAAGAYPRVSVGAFNGWQALEHVTDVPLAGRNDSSPALAGWASGPSFRDVGLGALAVYVGGCLMVLRRSREGHRRHGQRGQAEQRSGELITITLLTAAAAAFAFFMLPTQIHERYLFQALPLLCAVLPLSADVVVVYVLAAVGYALNVVRVLPWSPRVSELLEAAGLSDGRLAVIQVGAFLYLSAIVFLRLGLSTSRGGDRAASAPAWPNRLWGRSRLAPAAQPTRPVVRAFAVSATVCALATAAAFATHPRTPDALQVDLGGLLELLVVLALPLRIAFTQLPQARTPDTR